MTAPQRFSLRDPATPKPGSALALLHEVVADNRLTVEFSPEVMEEVAEIQRNPGIDDPGLVDLTALPFVTVDNEDSKDLDQALYIGRNASTRGFDVYYALADAAYYVKPGMALFDEAMRRGVTYYLPGFSVPMLPRELSEGIVSLNEGVDRRALVFRISLDADGIAVNTHIARARIRSRRKLSYHGVQRYHDRTDAHPLAGQEFTETLDLLDDVGQRRIADAEDRDVVRYDRVAVEVRLADAAGERLSVTGDVRNDVERWNEQISLLCNIEGAKFLRMDIDDDTRLAGIFRVHPSPPAERFDAFHILVRELVDALGLDPQIWSWSREPPAAESLADYIDRLPDEGPGHRLAMAIQRQALIINERSFFSTTPGRHHGIGAGAYSRFSSPMRQVVGIVTHHLALEQLGRAARGDSGLVGETIERAVDRANEADEIQKRINKAVQKIAIDQLFQSDLETPLATRPVHTGTVMGLTPSKIHVQLDEPPIDVKLYVTDLAKATGASYELRNRDTQLWRAPTADRSEKLLAQLGSEIRIRAASYDEARRRWELEPAD